MSQFPLRSLFLLSILYSTVHSLTIDEIIEESFKTKVTDSLKGIQQEVQNALEDTAVSKKCLTQYNQLKNLMNECEEKQDEEDEGVNERRIAREKRRQAEIERGEYVVGENEGEVPDQAEIEKGEVDDDRAEVDDDGYEIPEAAEVGEVEDSQRVKKLKLRLAAAEAEAEAEALKRKLKDVGKDVKPKQVGEVEDTKKVKKLKLQLAEAEAEDLAKRLKSGADSKTTKSKKSKKSQPSQDCSKLSKLQENLQQQCVQVLHYKDCLEPIQDFINSLSNATVYESYAELEDCSCTELPFQKYHEDLKNARIVMFLADYVLEYPQLDGNFRASLEGYTNFAEKLLKEEGTVLEQYTGVIYLASNQPVRQKLKELGLLKEDL